MANTRTSPAGRLTCCSYWAGTLRLVLDVQISPRKQHTSLHARDGLLDELGGRGPALVRGDCGYCNKDILTVLGA